MSKKTAAVTKLNERALLVHLSVSMWEGKQMDTKVSHDVCTDKGAKADAGAWWTRLVPKTALKAMDSARGRCRTQFVKMTLPWMDGGFRVLPSALFMDYTKRMRGVMGEYEEAVEGFLKEYPTLVEDAKTRLGKLLDTTRLPSVDEIRSKFAVRLDVLPIPVADDFRVRMEDEDLAEARKKVEATVQASLETAMGELWTQFATIVEKIQNTMGNPNKSFKSSIIENLRDFCHVLPKMNIAGDTHLDELRKEAEEKLAKMSPDELRGSQVSRKKAHTEAKDLLKKIASYTGR